MEPQLRFLNSADGTRIAYAVMGDGSGTPVVSVNSGFFTLDAIMGHPGPRAYHEGLSEGRRLITFDRRGMGASQRDVSDLSFDSHVSDVAAVVDRLGLANFHLIGYADGAAICAAYAVRNPQRVVRLVLDGVFARGSGRSEGMTLLVRENWSWARRVAASVTFPNGPIELQRWMSTTLREAMTPEVAAASFELSATLDIADLLPRVQAPTLVLYYREDPGIQRSREVASLIPDARFLALEGNSASWFADSSDFTRVVKEFFADAETPPAPALPHGTAIILFADIADSTALTERMGDDAFRAKARELDVALRQLIQDASGTPIKGRLVGDGLMAVFTSAREAIDGALRCRDAADSIGLPLHLGIHAGDVIRDGDNVYGGAVNIASRISGLTAAGELLVSDTVRGLARTSAGVTFEDRGEQSLKGIGDPLRVWAVRPAAPPNPGSA